MFAKTVLALPVQDPTSGYRCYARDVVTRLLNGPLESNGYAFQVEATYRCMSMRVPMSEIPYTFIDRMRGTSKLGIRIVVEYLWIVLAMRFSRQRNRVETH